MEGLRYFGLLYTFGLQLPTALPSLANDKGICPLWSKSSGEWKVTHPWFRACTMSNRSFLEKPKGVHLLTLGSPLKSELSRGTHLGAFLLILLNLLDADQIPCDGNFLVL